MDTRHCDVEQLIFLCRVQSETFGLEWGTKERQHKSGKSTGKMEPLTQVRRKIKAMQPQARRVFAEALRQSIAAQGQNRITATQGRQMFERFAK